jgi:hypothetical protein
LLLLFLSLGRALVTLAHYYLAKPGYEAQAVGYLQTAVDDYNDLEGWHELGCCVFQGRGTPQDKIRGVELLKHAAANGHAGASAKLTAISREEPPRCTPARNLLPLRKREKVSSLSPSRLVRKLPPTKINTLSKSSSSRKISKISSKQTLHLDTKKEATKSDETLYLNARRKAAIVDKEVLSIQDIEQSFVNSFKEQHLNELAGELILSSKVVKQIHVMNLEEDPGFGEAIESRASFSA